MKNFSKSFLTRFMSILILAIIGFSVVVIVLLPYIADLYLGAINALTRPVKNTLLVVLYPSGVLAVLIELEVYRIFRSLNRNNPFVTQNVLAFKRIAVYLFLIAGMFVYKIIKLNSLMTMFGAFGFLIVGLLMLVISDLFHQAVLYKEDNDLTI